MFRRAPLAALALSFFAAQGACSSCGSGSAATDAAPASSTTTTTGTVASANASARAAASGAGAGVPVTVPAGAGATGGCALDGDPVVVDKLVRTDTGVSAGIGGTMAIGWARAQGTVAAATIDDAGVVTVAEVSDPFPGLEQKPAAGTTRVLQRVVPIARDGAKVKVSVDWVETTTDKRRHLRCGPADVALAEHDGPSLIGGADAASELVDCRTMAFDGKLGALQSTLERDGTKLTARLRLDGTLAAERVTTLKAGELPNERWAFTHLAVERAPAGFVVAARHNGSVIVARVGAGLTAPADVGSWLGTATNRPAIAFGEGDRIEIWNTLMGKPDLYATRFTWAKKPEAPQAVTLAETADERGFVAALGRANDTILLVSEKTGGKKSMLVRRYDASGALLGTLTLGGANETIAEARAIALPSGKVLFVWASTEDGKSLVKSAVGTCGDVAGTDGGAAAPTTASASASASASAPASASASASASGAASASASAAP